MDDPNVLPDQAQEPPSPPAPGPEPEPPAPQYDIEQAYQRVAEHQGWDPRLTQYELNEIKRRREELERERREFEAERARRYEPAEDTSGDPYLNRISKLERLILEEREEKRREREHNALVGRVETELRSAYTSIARQMGMTREQMDKSSQDFYETLAEMYPAHSMIQEIGAERAARNAFRNMSNNGTRPAGGLNRVNPRERIVMPSPQSGPGPGPSQAFDEASQRENETNEQYLERLTRLVRGNNIGLNALPEGRKFSSG